MKKTTQLIPLRLMLICLVGTAMFGTAVRGQEKAAGGDSDVEREIDDEELARRLQGESAGQAAENALTRMLRYMTQSRDGLRDRFDPGDKTQTIQKKILDDLDEAIRFARSQMRKKSKGQGSSSGSDKRRAGKPRKAGSSSQAKKGAKQPSPAGAEDETATHGRARSGRLGGDFHETGREWGHLPPRAREEVVQGFSEDVLLKYKAQIEKYYRALAEKNGGR